MCRAPAEFDSRLAPAHLLVDRETLIPLAECALGLPDRDHFDVSADVEVITVREAKSTLGEWYEGFAIDQQMSGRKATIELGWRPTHVDPIADLLG